MDHIRYPTLVDKIKEIYYKSEKNEKYREDIIDKIRNFVRTKFKFKNDSQLDTCLFKSRPVEFRNAIFGAASSKMRSHMNRGEDDTQCEMSTRKGAGHFEEGEICWICNQVIIIDPDIDTKQYNCEHIIPVLRAVMFTGLLNQEPWQMGALGDETDFLAKIRNENYLWSHACCNNAKNDDIWFTFDKGFFVPDPVEIRRSFVQKIVKNCDFVTIDMVNERVQSICEEMELKCEDINSEFRELNIIFTPTGDHRTLWTLYIFYIICIVQMSSNLISEKIKENIDEFIDRFDFPKFGYTRLTDKMRDTRKQIFQLKKKLQVSRIYGLDDTLQYCINHLKEYCNYNIVKLSNDDVRNMTDLFTEILHIKHINDKGDVLLNNYFVDLFGWSYSFIDHIITLLGPTKKKCFFFFLFLRDFHTTYRSYTSFWDTFYESYQNDALYIKFKTLIRQKLNIDLTQYERKCKSYINRTLNTDRFVEYPRRRKN